MKKKLATLGGTVLLFLAFTIASVIWEPHSAVMRSYVYLAVLVPLGLLLLRYGMRKNH